MKTNKMVLSVMFVFASTFSWGANECTKDGGEHVCVNPMAEDWSYTIGNSLTNFYGSTRIFVCNIFGGEMKGSYPNRSCSIDNPEALIKESNVRSTADKFINNLSKKPPSFLSETNWGGDENNLLWSKNERSKYYTIPNIEYKFFTYQVDDKIDHIAYRRERKIECKTGMKKTIDPEGHFQCYHEELVKTKTCTVVGNPCSITTGDKTLIENDWVSSVGPLKVTRYYSSLNSTKVPWMYNYDGNIDIGEIQDIKLNLKSNSLKEGNSSIILNRANGTRAIAQRNFTDRTIAKDTKWFVDRDLSLQIIQNEDNISVKNVKTGVVETYHPLNNKKYTYKLARIDYPNQEFLTFTHSNNHINSITDNKGNKLQYFYGKDGQVAYILLPNGKKIDYTYDEVGRLSSVTRPGYGTKTYLYDEADKAPNNNPNLLTGIIDENGKRYATYAYDKQNRGILTEHAHNSQRFELTYNTNSTKVIDENGATRNYNLVLISGSNRISHQNIGNKKTANKYDKAGNLTERTINGTTTRHTYDLSRNLRTSTINAYSTPESTITLTEWHPTLPVKTKITEGTANADGTLKQALRESSHTHDDRGNVLTRTITDVQTGKTRTWTNTYNKHNQKLTETDPTGLTQYWKYTDKGYLKQHTNPQGLITTYSEHNIDGKPQTITTATGQITRLSYDEAGRTIKQSTIIKTPTLDSLAKEKDNLIKFKNWWRKSFNMPLLPNPVKHDIKQQSEQTATTSYEYDLVGQLIRTTLPDGQIINYTYDDAHRLIGMTDSLGNRIEYTLNSAGDITETKNYDPQGTLANSSKQTFDTLGRLDKQQGNNGQIQDYEYDYQNNHEQPNSSQNALGHNTKTTYDKLGRTKNQTDANNSKINYQYDGLGNLTQVKDAKGNTTTYTYNAFGELLEVNSPDTGKTTYTYNDKGQLTQQTDAAGRVQNHQYDGKGRLIKITDQNNQLINGYQYDNSGRINKLTTSDTTIDYTLNSNNQIIEKVQTVKGQTQKTITRYSYTNGGQNKEIRLNSGKLINYQYNDKGTLTGILIKHNDSTQLIDNLQYNPNGIASYTWSQTNQPVNHTYDLDGRLTAIKDNALNRTLNYDKGNRITDIFDNTTNISFNYQHDSLDRLLKQTLKQAETTNNMSYQYDTNSNRTAKTKNGVSTNTPVKSENNQLENVTYDASGRTLNDGTHQYEYDTAGRIKQITHGSQGGHYFYNALGQRVQKNSNGKTTYYNYDESGQLIGEYDKDGKAIREYVYLGNMPIAMMSSERDGEILQVHTDHLGTPRVVSDKEQNILWKWEGDQFGDVVPQVATITMPLRHAGQYADKESGLFYNYFRYYDPKSGRYLRSDPIGLDGGLNTYGYVGASPLLGIDPRGLAPWVWDGQGDTSVCSYYDEMYQKTNCAYYKKAGQICRGKNNSVNYLMSVALTHSWLRGKTDNSQSTILTNIRTSLVSYDKTSRSLNNIGECECNKGDFIDLYHNLAFKDAGVNPMFYGGNLWFQSIPPNVVPFDGRSNSKYDPRNFLPTDTSEGECSCSVE